MTDEYSLIGLRPVGKQVLVYIYDDGESSIDIGGGKRLITGIRDTEFDSVHRQNLDDKHPGIRGRWALVVGINEHTPEAIELGDKVFLDTMKWSRGIMAAETGERVWKIPPDDILAVDKDGPTDEEASIIILYLAAFDPELVAAASDPEFIVNVVETVEEEKKSGTNLKNWM